MTTYKSPIKKISSAGSKLASAVHSAIIDSSFQSSPPKQQHDQSTKRRSGAGIRDRINKFDAACRHNDARAPRRLMSAARSYPSNQNYCPDNGMDVDKENMDQPQIGGNGMDLQQVDKDDATNTLTSPSRQHGKIRQKLQETLSPLTERDIADKTILKVKAAFAPVTKDDNGNINLRKKVQSTFSPNKKPVDQHKNASSKQKKSMFSPQLLAATETFDSTSSSATNYDEESEIKKRLLQLEEENKVLQKKNQSLVKKCQLLAEANQTFQASGSQVENSVNIGRCKRPHTKTEFAAKKILRNEHPLIASPLRNHVLAVQEASETNSYISVNKEPFVLFPPKHIPRNEQGNNDHLDNLGVLTGNVQVETDDAPEYDEPSNAGEKRKNEEAIDLLNSAAFLFKTSRRRLN